MSKKNDYQKTKNHQSDLDVSKKAQVLGKDKPGRSVPLAAYIVIAVILVAGAAGMTVWLWPAGNSASAAAGSKENVIALPAADFDDGQARHYTYKTGNGLKVQFFVLKSTDGVIRAAFDACDVCWRSGLGYHQEGDVMVCRNCGRRFASDRINEVKGGCNPAPLNRQVENGQVVIKASEILEGQRFFNFSS